MNEKEEQQDTKQEDTYSYEGWINSDKFLKRAFAIYGHSIVASAIVALVFFTLILIAELIVG